MHTFPLGRQKLTGQHTMKKINLQNLPWAASVLLVAIFIYSCKRDSGEAMSELNQALIGKAKQFYQRETINFESRNRYVLSSEKTGSEAEGNISVNPIWEKAAIETSPGGKKLITVPIPDFDLVTKTSAYARKIVFETRGETINEGQIVEVFSTPAEISSNGDKRLRDASDENMTGFTGAVMTYNLNYVYKQGRYYENGRARKGIAKIAKKKTLLKGQLALPGSGNISGGVGKLAATSGSISAITPEFEGQDCENYYLVYIERDEFGTIVYWENRGYQYTICKSTNPDGPSPGGGYVEYYVDCNNTVNGNAYRDYCGDCVAGNTGLTPCPKTEVKKDSLDKYYPCMVKEVLNKLFQSESYSKLIQPFQAILLPNGNQIILPGMPNLTFDFSAQPYGGSGTVYKMGERESVRNQAMSSVIRFNSAAMNNASKLYLQVAAIHESGHAYANFYYKAAYYGFPIDTAEYPSWAMNIVRLDALASGQIQTNNFNDHSMFLENYVDKFVLILKELNGTAYTDQEYQMAALFGLNNPGDAPIDPLELAIFNIYKGKMDKSYNNLLTKYGITSAQINSFNRDNLINVPTAKKLPTNCP